MLESIGTKYAKGELLTGEVKKILITELQNIVKNHKENRAKVTDEMVRMFMDPTRPSLKKFAANRSPEVSHANLLH